VKGIIIELFSKRGRFLAAENDALNHHVVSSNHHNFTIEEPRSVLAFFQDPLQNRLKNNKNYPFRPPKKYSRKNRFRMTKWTGKVSA
jgi:hypothetical protein